MSPKPKQKDHARRWLMAVLVFAACESDDSTVADQLGGGEQSDVTETDAGLQGLLFEDLTVEAGIDLDRGETIAYATFMDRSSGGVCVLDLDGKPPLDLFFAMREVAGSDQGSRLYVGAGPWKWQDETAARGLVDLGSAAGCLAFDHDGDGDDDLLVTGLGSLRLYDNHGGQLVEAVGALGPEPAPASTWSSAAAGDLNGDGRLDLVIAGFIVSDFARTRVFEECLSGEDALTCNFFPREEDYLPNRLYWNTVHAGFVLAPTEDAPQLHVAEPTLSVAIHDFNEDGRSDIWVGNDMDVPNRVLIQLIDGRFDDFGEVVGLASDAEGGAMSAMGWAAGDIDGDLDFDYAVSDFEGRPSAIFLCEIPWSCTDEGPDRGTVATMWTMRWAEALFDVDLDGDVDLFEVTGHGYTQAESDALNVGPHAQVSRLMLNDGGGRFSPAALTPEDGLATPHSARGLVVADLDDDGRLDVVLAPSTGRPALLRNVHRAGGHWLRVVLPAGEPTTVGTRVVVTTSTGRQLLRVKLVGEGYLGNFDPRLHFGIPAGEGPVDVQLTWPDGTGSTVEGVAVDRELVVERP